ncbi:SAVMC3_10250 family protein [Nonomuraea sp. NPDC050227]|uniref:SAVMC3_10250 family protein n=1 Tax=Nonomuraea sp. NPDC050227 TaxID=3364360 RepID=UPI0037B2FB53
MRELVYVSERKLRQFSPRRSASGWWERITGLAIKGPFGLGEASVSLANGTSVRHLNLAQVIRYIERAHRPLASYLDEALEPGQWIKFEARLSYKFRRWEDGYGQSRAMLFFWEPTPHDSPTVTRLLLHGSPAHLVGAADVPETSFSFSHGPAFAEWLATIAEKENETIRKRINNKTVNLPPFIEPAKYAGQTLRDLDLGLPIQRTPGEILQHELKRNEPTERFVDTLASQMAGWMAGYAQVTAVLHLDSKFDTSQLVVASPLFVERHANSSRRCQRTNTAS